MPATRHGAGTDRRPRSRAPGRLAALAAAALVALTAAGCQPEQELELPTDAELEGTYGEATTVRLNGNVVVVEATQESRQLQRGGELWARVGPYIYVFSPQTQEIFQTWNGVAAVRVRTVTPGGREVARAQLARDELNTVTWREATNHVVRARTKGSEHPSYLAELVDYGEDHTTYEYSDRFVE